MKLNFFNNNTKKEKKEVVVKRRIDSLDVEYVQLSKEYSAPPQATIDDGDVMIKNGENNLYPYYLLELFRNSGLHRSIIEKIVDILLGTDLVIKDDEDNDDIKMANRFETYDEVLEKSAYDYKIFGGYYLQIIWNKSTNKLQEFYHMPYQRMRKGVPNKFGFSEKFYYWSKNDEKITSWNNPSEFVEIDAFNINNKTKNQIIFIKKHSPGDEYYGAPRYEGSLLDIQTYGEISNFHNSNLHNGFSPGFVLLFRGPEPTEDQKDVIVKTLKSKYGGSEKTGKPLVLFLDSEQEEPIVKPLDTSNLDKQFDSLLKSITQNILLGHGIPKQIMGIETTGSLGSSKEILQSLQMYVDTTIKGEQKNLLKGFNMIQAVKGEGELIIKNPNPSLLIYDLNSLINLVNKNDLLNYLGFDSEEEEKEEVEVEEVITEKEEDGK